MTKSVTLRDHRRMASDYARALGARLRAIRTQQGLSLHGVEEVVINKDVQQRTETVRDTARKTEVEVEKLSAEQRRTDATRETGRTK